MTHYFPTNNWKTKWYTGPRNTTHVQFQHRRNNTWVSPLTAEPGLSAPRIRSTFLWSVYFWSFTEAKITKGQAQAVCWVWKTFPEVCSWCHFGIKEVKCSLFRPRKNIWDSRGTAPLMLNLSTRWRWVVSFMCQLLHLREKLPHSLNRRGCTRLSSFNYWTTVP